MALFTKMDAERAAADHIALSGRPRLMPLEELPPAYRAEVKKVVDQPMDLDFESGPGRRQRKEVNYGEDRLTDDQFFRALDDDGDEEMEESEARRRTKADNKAHPSRSKANSTANNSRMASPADFSGPRNKAGGRRNKKVAESPSVQDNESPEPQASTSRKRGRDESMSVSVAGEEAKPISVSRVLRACHGRGISDWATAEKAKVQRRPERAPALQAIDDGHVRDHQHDDDRGRRVPVSGRLR